MQATFFSHAAFGSNLTPTREQLETAISQPLLAYDRRAVLATWVGALMRAHSDVGSTSSLPSAHPNAQEHADKLAAEQLAVLELTAMQADTVGVGAPAGTSPLLSPSTLLLEADPTAMLGPLERPLAVCSSRSHHLAAGERKRSTLGLCAGVHHGFVPAPPTQHMSSADSNSVNSASRQNSSSISTHTTGDGQLDAIYTYLFGAQANRRQLATADDAPLLDLAVAVKHFINHQFSSLHSNDVASPSSSVVPHTILFPFYAGKTDLNAVDSDSTTVTAWDLGVLTLRFIRHSGVSEESNHSAKSSWTEVEKQWQAMDAAEAAASGDAPAAVAPPTPPGALTNPHFICIVGELQIFSAPPTLGDASANPIVMTAQPGEMFPALQSLVHLLRRVCACDDVQLTLLPRVLWRQCRDEFSQSVIAAHNGVQLLHSVLSLSSPSSSHMFAPGEQCFPHGTIDVRLAQVPLIHLTLAHFSTSLTPYSSSTCASVLVPAPDDPLHASETAVLQGAADAMSRTLKRSREKLTKLNAQVSAANIELRRLEERATRAAIQEEQKTQNDELADQLRESEDETNESALPLSAPTAAAAAAVAVSATPAASSTSTNPANKKGTSKHPANAKSASSVRLRSPKKQREQRKQLAPSQRPETSAFPPNSPCALELARLQKLQKQLEDAIEQSLQDGNEPLGDLRRLNTLLEPSAALKAGAGPCALFESLSMPPVGGISHAHLFPQLSDAAAAILDGSLLSEISARHQAAAARDVNMRQADIHKAHIEQLEQSIKTYETRILKNEEELQCQRLYLENNEHKLADATKVMGDWVKTLVQAKTSTATAETEVSTQECALSAEVRRAADEYVGFSARVSAADRSMAAIVPWQLRASSGGNPHDVSARNWIQVNGHLVPRPHAISRGIAAAIFDATNGTLLHFFNFDTCGGAEMGQHLVNSLNATWGQGALNRVLLWLVCDEAIHNLKPETRSALGGFSSEQIKLLQWREPHIFVAQRSSTGVQVLCDGRLGTEQTLGLPLITVDFRAHLHPPLEAQRNEALTQQTVQWRVAEHTKHTKQALLDELYTKLLLCRAAEASATEAHGNATKLVTSCEGAVNRLKERIQFLCDMNATCLQAVKKFLQEVADKKKLLLVADVPAAATDDASSSAPPAPLASQSSAEVSRLIALRAEKITAVEKLGETRRRLRLDLSECKHAQEELLITTPGAVHLQLVAQRELVERLTLTVASLTSGLHDGLEQVLLVRQLAPSSFDLAEVSLALRCPPALVDVVIALLCGVFHFYSASGFDDLTRPQLPERGPVKAALLAVVKLLSEDPFIQSPGPVALTQPILERVLRVVQDHTQSWHSCALKLLLADLDDHTGPGVVTAAGAAPSSAPPLVVRAVRVHGRVYSLLPCDQLWDMTQHAHRITGALASISASLQADSELGVNSGGGSLLGAIAWEGLRQHLARAGVVLQTPRPVGSSNVPSSESASSSSSAQLALPLPPPPPLPPLPIPRILDWCDAQSSLLDVLTDGGRHYQWTEFHRLILSPISRRMRAQDEEEETAEVADIFPVAEWNASDDNECHIAFSLVDRLHRLLPSSISATHSGIAQRLSCDYIEAMRREVASLLEHCRRREQQLSIHCTSEQQAIELKISKKAQEVRELEKRAATEEEIMSKLKNEIGEQRALQERTAESAEATLNELKKRVETLEIKLKAADEKHAKIVAELAQGQSSEADAKHRAAETAAEVLRTVEELNVVGLEHAAATAASENANDKLRLLTAELEGCNNQQQSATVRREGLQHRLEQFELVEEYTRRVVRYFRTQFHLWTPVDGVAPAPVVDYREQLRSIQLSVDNKLPLLMKFRETIAVDLEKQIPLEVRPTLDGSSMSASAGSGAPLDAAVPAPSAVGDGLVAAATAAPAGLQRQRPNLSTCFGDGGILSTDPALISFVVNSILEVIAEPRAHHDDSKQRIELKGYMVSLSEVNLMLRAKIENNLTAYGFSLVDDVLRANAKPASGSVRRVEDLYPALHDLVNHRIELRYLQHLWPAKKSDDLYSAIDELHVSYAELLHAHFRGGIEVMAGCTLMLDVTRWEVRGIDVTLCAAQRVAMPRGHVTIDSRGLDAIDVTNLKASNGDCFRNPNDPKPRGNAGCDGLNGDAGHSGGHVHIKCANQADGDCRIDTTFSAAEFSSLTVLCSGGNGAAGQNGGDGDEGAVGRGTNDATPTSISGFSRAQYRLALARIPGIDVNGRATIEAEMSGAGGRPGLTGLSGQGGMPGEFCLEDLSNHVSRLRHPPRFHLVGALATDAESARDFQSRHISSFKHGSMPPDRSSASIGGDSGQPGPIGQDVEKRKSGLFSGTDTQKGAFAASDISSEATSSRDLIDLDTAAAFLIGGPSTLGLGAVLGVFSAKKEIHGFCNDYRAELLIDGGVRHATPASQQEINLRRDNRSRGLSRLGERGLQREESTRNRADQRVHRTTQASHQLRLTQSLHDLARTPQLDLYAENNAIRKCTMKELILVDDGIIQQCTQRSNVLAAQQRVAAPQAGKATMAKKQLDTRRANLEQQLNMLDNAARASDQSLATEMANVTKLEHQLVAAELSQVDAFHRAQCVIHTRNDFHEQQQHLQVLFHELTRMTSHGAEVSSQTRRDLLALISLKQQQIQRLSLQALQMVSTSDVSNDQIVVIEDALIHLAKQAAVTAQAALQRQQQQLHIQIEAVGTADQQLSMSDPSAVRKTRAAPPAVAEASELAQQAQDRVALMCRSLDVISALDTRESQAADIDAQCAGSIVTLIESLAEKLHAPNQPTPALELALARAELCFLVHASGRSGCTDAWQTATSVLELSVSDIDRVYSAWCGPLHWRERFKRSASPSESAFTLRPVPALGSRDRLSATLAAAELQFLRHHELLHRSDVSLVSSFSLSAHYCNEWMTPLERRLTRFVQLADSLRVCEPHYLADIVGVVEAYAEELDGILTGQGCMLSLLHGCVDRFVTHILAELRCFIWRTTHLDSSSMYQLTATVLALRQLIRPLRSTLLVSPQTERAVDALLDYSDGRWKLSVDQAALNVERVLTHDPPKGSSNAAEQEEKKEQAEEKVAERRFASHREDFHGLMLHVYRLFARVLLRDAEWYHVNDFLALLSNPTIAREQLLQECTATSALITMGNTHKPPLEPVPSDPHIPAVAPPLRAEHSLFARFRSVFAKLHRQDVVKLQPTWKSIWSALSTMLDSCLMGERQTAAAVEDCCKAVDIVNTMVTRITMSERRRTDDSSASALETASLGELRRWHFVLGQVLRSSVWNEITLQGWTALDPQQQDCLIGAWLRLALRLEQRFLTRWLQALSCPTEFKPEGTAALRDVLSDVLLSRLAASEHSPAGIAGQCVARASLLEFLEQLRTLVDAGNPMEQVSQIKQMMCVLQASVQAARTADVQPITKQGEVEVLQFLTSVSSFVDPKSTSLEGFQWAMLARMMRVTQLVDTSRDLAGQQKATEPAVLEQMRCQLKVSHQRFVDIKERTPQHASAQGVLATLARQHRKSLVRWCAIDMVLDLGSKSQNPQQSQLERALAWTQRAVERAQALETSQQHSSRPSSGISKAALALLQDACLDSHSLAVDPSLPPPFYDNSPSLRLLRQLVDPAVNLPSDLLTSANRELLSLLNLALLQCADWSLVALPNSQTVSVTALPPPAGSQLQIKLSRFALENKSDMVDGVSNLRLCVAQLPELFQHIRQRDTQLRSNDDRVWQQAPVVSPDNSCLSTAQAEVILLSVCRSHAQGSLRRCLYQLQQELLRASAELSASGAAVSIESDAPAKIALARRFVLCILHDRLRAVEAGLLQLELVSEQWSAPALTGVRGSEAVQRLGELTQLVLDLVNQSASMVLEAESVALLVNGQVVDWPEYRNALLAVPVHSTTEQLQLLLKSYPRPDEIQSLLDASSATALWTAVKSGSSTIPIILPQLDVDWLLKSLQEVEALVSAVAATSASSSALPHAGQKEDMTLPARMQSLQFQLSVIIRAVCQSLNLPAVPLLDDESKLALTYRHADQLVHLPISNYQWVKLENALLKACCNSSTSPAARSRFKLWQRCVSELMAQLLVHSVIRPSVPVSAACASTPATDSASSHSGGLAPVSRFVSDLLEHECACIEDPTFRGHKVRWLRELAQRVGPTAGDGWSADLTIDRLRFLILQSNCASLKELSGLFDSQSIRPGGMQPQPQWDAHKALLQSRDAALEAVKARLTRVSDVANEDAKEDKVEDSVISIFQAWQKYLTLSLDFIAAQAGDSSWTQVAYQPASSPLPLSVDALLQSSCTLLQLLIFDDDDSQYELLQVEKMVRRFVAAHLERPADGSAGPTAQPLHTALFDQLIWSCGAAAHRPAQFSRINWRPPVASQSSPSVSSLTPMASGAQEEAQTKPEQQLRLLMAQWLWLLNAAPECTIGVAELHASLHAEGDKLVSVRTRLLKFVGHDSPMVLIQNICENLRIFRSHSTKPNPDTKLHQICVQLCFLHQWHNVGEVLESDQQPTLPLLAGDIKDLQAVFNAIIERSSPGDLLLKWLRSDLTHQLSSWIDAVVAQQPIATMDFEQPWMEIKALLVHSCTDEPSANETCTLLGCIADQLHVWVGKHTATEPPAQASDVGAASGSLSRLRQEFAHCLAGSVVKFRSITGVRFDCQSSAAAAVMSVMSCRSSIPSGPSIALSSLLLPSELPDHCWSHFYPTIIALLDTLNRIHRDRPSSLPLYRLHVQQLLSLVHAAVRAVRCPLGGASLSACVVRAVDEWFVRLQSASLTVDGTIESAVFVPAIAGVGTVVTWLDKVHKTAAPLQLLESWCRDVPVSLSADREQHIQLLCSDSDMVFLRALRTDEAGREKQMLELCTTADQATPPARWTALLQRRFLAERLSTLFLGLWIPYHKVLNTHPGVADQIAELIRVQRVQDLPQKAAAVELAFTRLRERAWFSDGNAGAAAAAVELQQLMPEHTPADLLDCPELDELREMTALLHASCALHLALLLARDHFHHECEHAVFVELCQLLVDPTVTHGATRASLLLQHYQLRAMRQLLEVAPMLPAGQVAELLQGHRASTGIISAPLLHQMLVRAVVSTVQRNVLQVSGVESTDHPAPADVAALTSVRTLCAALHGHERMHDSARAALHLLLRALHQAVAGSAAPAETAAILSVDRLECTLRLLEQVGAYDAWPDGAVAGVHWLEPLLTQSSGELLPLSAWCHVLQRQLLRKRFEFQVGHIEHEQCVEQLLLLQHRVHSAWFDALLDALECSIHSDCPVPASALHLVLTSFSSGLWQLDPVALAVLKPDLKGHMWYSCLSAHFNSLESMRQQQQRGIADVVSAMFADPQMSASSEVLELICGAPSPLVASYMRVFERVNGEIAEHQGHQAVDANDRDLTRAQEFRTRFHELRHTQDASVARKQDCTEDFFVFLIRCVWSVKRFTLNPSQFAALYVFVHGFHRPHGRIAAIRTGEGKTIVTACLAICRVFLLGGKVDVCSSSRVLAQRDAEDAAALFGRMGVRVSNNCDEAAEANLNTRAQRYQDHDVIYGELGCFQRDYLLSAYFLQPIRSGVAQGLIIDEADTTLIDNAERVLYISHSIEDLAYLDETLVLVWAATHGPDARKRSEANIEAVSKAILAKIHSGEIRAPTHLRAFITRSLRTWVESAYTAHEMTESHQYSIGHLQQLEVLKGAGKTVDAAIAHVADDVSRSSVALDGRPIVIDLNTGVEQPNTAWSNGLQQFVQLKHRAVLTSQSLKAVFISTLNFIRLYGQHVNGMTGTVGGQMEERLLSQLYGGLDCFRVPSATVSRMLIEPHLVRSSVEEWKHAIRDDVFAKLNVSHVITPQEMREATETREKQSSIRDELTASNKKLQKELRQAEQSRLTAKNLVQVCEAELGVSKVSEVRQQVRQQAQADLGQTAAQSAGSDAALLKQCRANTLSELREVEQQLAAAQSSCASLRTELRKNVDRLSKCAQAIRSAADIEQRRTSRAVLIICEHQRAVEEIMELLKSPCPPPATRSAPAAEAASFHTIRALYDYKSALSTSLTQRLADGQVSPGVVIVATNLGGRGLDLATSAALERNGGLHVILTYIPSNRRVEQQAFGRTARQGNTGSARYIVFTPTQHLATGVSVQSLCDERDQYEWAQLRAFKASKLPRIELEERLFREFAVLQTMIRELLGRDFRWGARSQDLLGDVMVAGNRVAGDLPVLNPPPAPQAESVLHALQIKSLQNHWAFWLHGESQAIQQAHERFPQPGAAVLTRLAAFKERMLQLYHMVPFGLVTEPGELFKLARYYVKQEQWELGAACYSRIIDLEPQMCGMARYYKVLCDYRDDVENSDEKRRLKTSLQQCLHQLRADVNRFSSLAQIVTTLSDARRRAGQGMESNRFARQMAEEQCVLQAHISAVQDMLGRDLSIDLLTHGPIDTEQATRIHDALLETADNVTGSRDAMSREELLELQQYFQRKRCRVRRRRLLFRGDALNREMYVFPPGCDESSAVLVKLPPEIDAMGVKQDLLTFIQSERSRDRQTSGDVKKKLEDFLSSNLLSPAALVAGLQRVGWCLAAAHDLVVVSLHASSSSNARDHGHLWSRHFRSSAQPCKEIVLQLQGNVARHLLESRLKQQCATLSEELIRAAVTELVAAKILKVEQSVYQLQMTTASVTPSCSEPDVAREGQDEEAKSEAASEAGQSHASPARQSHLLLEPALFAPLRHLPFNLLRKACGSQEELSRRLLELRAALVSPMLSPQQSAAIGQRLSTLAARSPDDAAELRIVCDHTESNCPRAPANSFLSTSGTVSCGLPHLTSAAQFVFLRRVLQQHQLLAETAFLQSLASHASFDHPTSLGCASALLPLVEQALLTVLSSSHPEWFTLSDLPLQEPTAVLDNLWSCLHAQGVVKGQAISCPFSRDASGRTDRLRELMKKLVKRIVSDKAADDAQSTVEDVLNQMIGTLRSIDKVNARSRCLSECFGSQTPCAISEHTRRGMDLVVVLRKAHGWFDWGALVVFLLGVIEVVAGVLVSIVCPYIGSVLIGEGVGDMIFAVSSSVAGTFSWKAYGEHKLISLALSFATCGVGAITSSIAATTGRVILTAILKQVLIHVLNALLSVAVNLIAAKLAEGVAEALINQIRSHVESEMNQNPQFRAVCNDLRSVWRALWKRDSCSAASISSRALERVDLHRILNAQVSAQVTSALSFASSKLQAMTSRLSGSGWVGTAATIIDAVSKVMTYAEIVHAISQLHTAALDVAKEVHTRLQRKLHEGGAEGSKPEPEDATPDANVNSFLEQQRVALVGTITADIQQYARSAVLQPAFRLGLEAIAQPFKRCLWVKPLTMSAMEDEVAVINTALAQGGGSLRDVQDRASLLLQLSAMRFGRVLTLDDLRTAVTTATVNVPQLGELALAQVEAHFGQSDVRFVEDSTGRLRLVCDFDSVLTTIGNDLTRGGLDNMLVAVLASAHGSSLKHLAIVEPEELIRLHREPGMQFLVRHGEHLAPIEFDGSGKAHEVQLDVPAAPVDAPSQASVSSGRSPARAPPLRACPSSDVALTAQALKYLAERADGHSTEQSAAAVRSMDVNQMVGAAVEAARSSAAVHEVFSGRALQDQSASIESMPTGPFSLTDPTQSYWHQFRDSPPEGDPSYPPTAQQQAQHQLSGELKFGKHLVSSARVVLDKVDKARGWANVAELKSSAKFASESLGFMSTYLERASQGYANESAILLAAHKTYFTLRCKAILEPATRGAATILGASLQTGGTTLLASVPLASPWVLPWLPAAAQFAGHGVAHLSAGFACSFAYESLFQAARIYGDEGVRAEEMRREEQRQKFWEDIQKQMKRRK